ncbi:MAG: glycosyltransferase [Halanaerobiales bacterium]|nr:glycosyltransferase [Halanaerobiales bacterium]
MESKKQISIIIPTRNRKIILKKCLEALNKQSIDSNKYEIIIIDDGSTQDIETMINSLNLKPEIKYHYQEHSGPAKSRNKGIKFAKGKYIIFIDDDIIVNEQFVESHLNKLLNNDKVIVHGPVIHTNNLDNPSAAEKKIRDFSSAFFATGNASIKKTYLKEAGLFNENFYEYGWEDLEFGKRLKQLNLKAVKAENAIGYHLKYQFSPNYLPNIKEKEKQRGRMAVLYHDINPSFSVKLSTLYWKPLLILLEVLTIGNWPESQFTMKLIKYLHENDLNNTRKFVVYFIKLNSYLKGLKEGY